MEESDVELLDKILNRLSEGKSVDSSAIIQMSIINVDLKHPGKAKKEAGELLESINQYISHYYGIINKKGSFGDDPYVLSKDERTIKFKNDGGFKGEFERQLLEQKKQNIKESRANELARLQKENLILQSEELIYHKKVRKWQIVSIITGIIGVIMGILLNPVIIDLLNKLYNKQ